jgi:hypothetical protein
MRNAMADPDDGTKLLDALGVLARATVKIGFNVGNWEVALPLGNGVVLPFRVVVALGTDEQRKLGELVKEHFGQGKDLTR